MEGQHLAPVHSQNKSTTQGPLDADVSLLPQPHSVRSLGDLEAGE